MRDVISVPPPAVVLRGLLMALMVTVVGASSAFSTDAGAQTAPGISVTPDPPIGRLGSPLDFVVEGRIADPAGGAVLTVTLQGSADPAAEPASVPVVGTVQRDMVDAGGEFSVAVPLEDFGDVGRPGGYIVTATLASGEDGEVSDSAWLGLAPAGAEVDLATVWPLAYGIHQAPDGAFIDTVIQEAIVPSTDAVGGVYAFIRAADRFASWRTSMAIEPVFLAQLQDMADGYVLRLPGEEKAEVDVSDETAEQARRVLELLRSVAGQDSMQMIAAPYAMPSFPLLGSRGWQDGLGQIQLGKTVLQEGLGLPETLDAGYPPGMELTTESISYLADASIDYAVVSPDVMADLAEEPESVYGPVRVRDLQNNRVTLLFAAPSLRAVLSDPWVPGRFFAALATDMSQGAPDALIAAPASDYGVPPFEFLDAVGEGLSRAAFVRTVTPAEVIERHPPPTRPIFLSRYGGRVEGFVGRAYEERLAETHRVVDDLREATDSDRSPLNDVLLDLYRGESRYWFADGADPEIANLGISYLDSARERVLEEFDKIDVAGDKSVILMGNAGEVPVAVVNQAGYPLSAEIVLEGNGLTVEGEERLRVTLGPQENVYQVPVDVETADAGLAVRVLIGSTQVDDVTIDVRSVSLRSLLPWLAAGLLAMGILALLVWRLRT